MAHILVVDDEAPIRSVVRQMLERAGHEVVEAPDGREASRVYRDKPSDLVIIDVIMPVQEGLETIRTLRGEFPGARIVAMSGRSDVGGVDFLSLARRLGAVTTLSKPFGRAELLEAVEGALAA